MEVIQIYLQLRPISLHFFCEFLILNFFSHLSVITGAEKGRLRLRNPAYNYDQFPCIFSVISSNFPLLDLDPHIECGSGRDNECGSMQIRIHSHAFNYGSIGYGLNLYESLKLS